MSTVLREHAEQQYAEELAALKQIDTRPRPPNWLLSPWAVVTYIMGAQLETGLMIKPKYWGARHLIERAVATLTTDRALLLVGLPGTAKSWVAEHLSAAICGNSTLLIQGTQGTEQQAFYYRWNDAFLLAKGLSPEALVPSPLMRGMELGKIVRLEDFTQIPNNVQDSLITLLSEKTLAIAEINDEIQAQRGFNVIATANNMDQGVYELSTALKRQFNIIELPLPAQLEDEVTIVEQRVIELARLLALPVAPPAVGEIQKVVTIFRELRQGMTENGKMKLKSPSAILSTAEAISVITEALSLAAYFGDGVLRAPNLAAGLMSAVIKASPQDHFIWREYLETVMKQRQDWHDLYQACRDLY